MMKRTLMFVGVIGLAFWVGVVHADVNFVNGGFENGNLDGWALGSQTYAGSTTTKAGTGVTAWTNAPGDYGSGQAAAVVTPGADPLVGIQMTYNGSYAAQVGDSTPWGNNGPYKSWITQSAAVTGTQPGNLYFAWASVLQISGHSQLDTPFFEVSVKDNTTGVTIYDVQHYETDSGFWTDKGNGWKYSTGNNGSYPGWYVETLDLAALGVAVGDNLTLQALARDCNLDGHAQYVYLDGFGGTPPPPPSVPEPATLLLLGAGLVGLGIGGKRLRK